MSCHWCRQVCGPRDTRLLAFLCGCGCGCVWNRHVPHLPCMPFPFSSMLLTRRRLGGLILWSACQESTGGASLDWWRTGAWGDDWLQPLSQIISATCTAAVRPQLIVDHGVEVKGGHIFPHPSAPHPSSYCDPLLHRTESMKEKQQVRIKKVYIEKSHFTQFYAWTIVWSFRIQNVIVNEGKKVTWIPFSLVWCVRFKLLTRQRPGWIEWLERPGDWGELLGTQTISTRPCIACCGPKSPHLSRQIDWTPGLVCLALLACWRGLEGSGECSLQRAQLMGTEQIMCSGQKMSLPTLWKTHW